MTTVYSILASVASSGHSRTIAFRETALFELENVQSTTKLLLILKNYNGFDGVRSEELHSSPAGGELEKGVEMTPWREYFIIENEVQYIAVVAYRQPPEEELRLVWC